MCKALLPPLLVYPCASNVQSVTNNRFEAQKVILLPPLVQASRLLLCFCWVGNHHPRSASFVSSQTPILINCTMLQYEFLPLLVYPCASNMQSVTNNRFEAQKVILLPPLAQASHLLLCFCWVGNHHPR
jgi:hypothetical protein